MAFNPLKIAHASFARALAEAVGQTGYGGQASIPEAMTFTEWAEDLGRRGLKVDRKPFRLDNRAALRPIYDAIPSTIEQARDGILVIQKATQLGLTVWEVLADLYMALKFGPLNLGMYLPDMSTAAFKSQQRFMPIVRSSPELLRLLTEREERGSKKKIGEGNVLTREFAGNLMLFLWTSGRVSTESRPMDVVSLDEVQEMTLDQIDKVMARMGDSAVRFTLMLSTANMPELDINHWYLTGTQEVWHTECESCGAMSDLSDPAGTFPTKSTAYNTGQVPGAPKDEFVWTCPACSAWIRDPQRGRYIATRPDLASSKIRSFLLPRTISPRITPREMVTNWARAKTGDQKKSFYNRTLARPYIDPSQVPVTLSHLKDAARRGMEMGLTWLSGGKGCYMGVDQMGGWNAVVIKRRLPDGRQAVVHCAALHGPDPFKDTSELMRRYGVAYCVVEQLPNVNDARRFANEFPGRVFLAGYADLRDDMMTWGDDLSRSDRRTAAEDRTRYTVTLNQYKAMQRTLFRLRDAECLWPDPAALEATIPIDGEDKRVLLVQDYVWDHYTKTALVVDHDEETRKPKARVKKMGLDPHFSFATMLCDIAWSRDAGGSAFLFLEGEQPARALEMPGAGRALDDQVPSQIRAMMEPPPPGTCGRCLSFTAGQCTARGFRVAPRDPGCGIFAPAS